MDVVVHFLVRRLGRSSRSPSLLRCFRFFRRCRRRWPLGVAFAGGGQSGFLRLCRRQRAGMPVAPGLCNLGPSRRCGGLRRNVRGRTRCCAHCAPALYPWARYRCARGTPGFRPWQGADPRALRTARPGCPCPVVLCMVCTGWRSLSAGLGASSRFAFLASGGWQPRPFPRRRSFPVRLLPI